MCSLFGHFKAAGFGGLQRQKAFVVDCLTQHVIPHFLLGGRCGTLWAGGLLYIRALPWVGACLCFGPLLTVLLCGTAL